MQYSVFLPHRKPGFARDNKKISLHYLVEPGVLKQRKTSDNKPLGHPGIPFKKSEHFNIYEGKKILSYTWEYNNTYRRIYNNIYILKISWRCMEKSILFRWFTCMVYMFTLLESCLHYPQCHLVTC